MSASQYYDQFTLIETKLQYYFVGEDMAHTTDEMRLCCGKLIEQLISDNTVQWIKEESCLTLPVESLTKLTAFITDKFSGDAFEYLKKTNAIILGPKCVLNCLHSNKPLPTISPIFNNIMQDLVVCASGLPKTEKEKIGQLVGYMGGHYIPDHLNWITTHLVSNTVQSKKYEQAAIHGKIIVKTSWVYAAWKSCQRNNAHASTLEAEHRLPMFYGLSFTSSGLSVSARNEIKSIIEENGGTYYGAFKADTVNILLTQREHTNSEKYKAAVNCNKDCLTPDWILNSLKKGYALPLNEYKINNSISKKILKSTPVKEIAAKSDESHFLGDCTNISEIVGNLTVNETQTSHKIMRQFSSKSNEKTYKNILANIDIKDAKKAGPFLDGCNIFLVGFNSEEKEKLHRILNAGGAIRFEEYSSKVSHILIGSPNTTELSELRAITEFVRMLEIDWLAESIIERQPASETKHIFSLQLEASSTILQNKNAMPSPATKKAIQSMHASFRAPTAIPRRLNLDCEVPNRNEKDQLLAQYLDNQQAVEPIVNPPSSINLQKENSAYETSTETQNLTFLHGLTVSIYGFVSESTHIVESRCKYAGATIVPSTASDFCVNYLIVPVDIMTLDEVKINYKSVVNDLWLDDSVDKDELVEIEYYHKPIIGDDTIRPLENITIVISTYTGHEKEFIQQVGNVLGADISEAYKRSEKPLLVCPKPQGYKYQGAVKWGLPAVTKDWIMDCLKYKRKSPLTPYLVGETKAPIDEIPSVDDISNLTLPQNCSKDAGVQLEENQKNASPLKNPQLNQINTVATPTGNAVRERRISEILASARKHKSTTSPVDTPEPLRAERRQAHCNVLPTPNREWMQDILKGIDEETPNTKRRRREVQTPKEIPEHCTQEYFDQRTREGYTRPLRPLKPKTPTTPLNETMKKFWINCMGDKYESPTLIMSQLSMRNDLATQAKASTATVSSTSLPAQQSNDSNVLRLSDFIKKRNVSRQIIVPQLEEQQVSQIQQQPNMESQSNEMHEIYTENCDEVVGWRDPDDFFQSERFKPDEKDKKRIFAISNISQDSTKLKLIEQIQQLNGELNTTINPNNLFTHLVCESVSKSEKIFSAIASGAWILHSKYITDSIEAGHFLAEELYEFGNPKFLFSNDHSQNKKISNGAYIWRKRLQEKSTANGKPIGAFTDFCVILHVSKKEVFKGLLECGGGEVIDITEPYSSHAEAIKATHCIVEEAKCQLSRSDRKFLTDHKVLCVNARFLQSYLTSELVPDPSYFILK